ncbi:MAG: prepilin peptidase, partial [Pseudomonadota bacterium]
MAALVFVLGACWGSFLGLVAYRVPRKISIITPRSFCDGCEDKFSFIYNIPVISFILLKGKCKNCGEKISWRYPFIELITAVLFVFGWIFFAEDYYYTLAKGFILVTFILPVIFIDIDERIIPDRFSIGLIIIGFVISFFDPGIMWHESLAGIILGGGLLYLVAEVYYWVTKREGMGGGDIKLMAGIGAVMGWYPVVMVIFLSSRIGSVYGVVMMVFFKKDRLKEM